MRAVGIDLGERRIGVAVSDSGGVLAVPHSTVSRSGDETEDHAALARIVEETGAERVVIGLPLSLDGSRGPAARKVLAEATAIEAAVGVPVELYDERFTTVSAARSLAGSGLSSRARRRVVDEAAATVLLQSWLDGRSGHGAPASSGPGSERR
ncbi:MAG: Holliday junction resolvase RuvX [Acidimicrobiia bacterium]